MEPRMTIARLWQTDEDYRNDYDDARHKYKAPLPSPQPESPAYCGSLTIETELECYAKYFPNEMTADRAEKIKAQLDALVKGIK